MDEETRCGGAVESGRINMCTLERRGLGLGWCPGFHLLCLASGLVE